MVENPETDSMRRDFGRRFFIIFMSLVLLAIIFNVARDSTLLNRIPDRYAIDLKWGFFALWLATGLFLMRHLQHLVHGMLTKRTHVDLRARLMVNRLLNALGYSFVIVEALHLLHVQVGSILVGGALTGVIVGIAAQSTLSNLFAGIILFTVRPFSIGQTIIIRSSLFGGVEYSGTVLDVNWFHTIVVNNDGQRLTIPNTSVIGAVVTTVADLRVQTYTVSLPYSASVHDFESKLHEIFGENVHLNIKEFADATYTVQIRLPSSADRDDLRKVLWELKSQV